MTDLRFVDCHTKAEYRSWIDCSLQEIGYSLGGAKWRVDLTFRQMKRAEVQELAEALRYGQFKRDFMPMLISKGLIVIRCDTEVTQEPTPCSTTNEIPPASCFG